MPLQYLRKFHTCECRIDLKFVHSSYYSYCSIGITVVHLMLHAFVFIWYIGDD